MMSLHEKREEGQQRCPAPPQASLDDVAVNSARGRLGTNVAQHSPHTHSAACRGSGGGSDEQVNGVSGTDNQRLERSSVLGISTSSSSVKVEAVNEACQDQLS
jgi:hypothetical protein